jgi:ubiquitin carboxyl-terminal hydrolase L5
MTRKRFPFSVVALALLPPSILSFRFHFVAYLPIGDCVYELDGLREAPIKVAELPPGVDWIHVVTPIIQQRMQK